MNQPVAAGMICAGLTGGTVNMLGASLWFSIFTGTLTGLIVQSLYEDHQRKRDKS